MLFINNLYLSSRGSKHTDYLADSCRAETPQSQPRKRNRLARSNRLMRRLLRPQTPSLPIKIILPSCVTSSPTARYSRISSRRTADCVFVSNRQLHDRPISRRRSHRSGKTAGQFQILDAPAPFIAAVRRAAQLYLIAWPIGYVEPIQPSGQTISNSLQNSLFSRPEAQKDAGLFLRGRRLRDPCRFRRREMRGGDIESLHITLHCLHVDPDFSGSCKGNRSQPAGMRYIEMKPAAFNEVRLAMAIRCQRNLPWRFL